MWKIIQLDKNLANQISAWEVIERPVSVIKELIENSIDAWSSQISVSIENWGIDKITIIDNGEWIDSDDLSRVVEKYSTSKIKTLEDLYNVMTFGFRWEAMASISSVSNMSIISKTNWCNIWNILEIIWWEQQKITSIACETGTKVIVENLFYNTPARLNYLKKARTEYSHILHLLEQIALSYPYIGLSFQSDGKEIFQYRQGESIETRIYSIYGELFSQNLIAVSHESVGIKIHGFISDPKINFPNKNRQSLFVNNRIVKSPLIIKAISDAYNRFIPHNCHSAYVLFIDVDPTQVDVNVHPRKLEVRFANESQLFRSLFHCVQDKLDQVSLIPSTHLNSDAHWENNNFSQPINQIDNIQKYYTGSGSKFKSYSPYSNKSPNPNQWQIHKAIDFSKTLLEHQNKHLEDQAIDQIWESNDLHDTPLWKIIGQAHNSYIIVQNKDGIVFYDQHALAERIIYEKLLKKDSGHRVQWLLIGEIIKVTSRELDILNENKLTFEEMGFEFEILPGHSVIINAVPDFIKKENISNVFLWVLEDIWDHNFWQSKTLSEIKNKIYAYVSCRSAIKFWHKLNLFEMNKLLNDAILDYSSTCPHGRPVVFNIHLEELKNKYER